MEGAIVTLCLLSFQVHIEKKKNLNSTLEKYFSLPHYISILLYWLAVALHIFIAAEP